jgi:formate--tetrahydrofolate ligase
VVVATVRALKYHGGMDVKALNSEDLEALEKGLVNLERHVHNVTRQLRPALRGLDQPLHLRHRGRDRAAHRAHDGSWASTWCSPSHWAEGGAGADERARARWCVWPRAAATATFVYEDADSLWDKMKKVATQRLRRRRHQCRRPRCGSRSRHWQDAGYGSYPICVAKTQ